MFPGVFGVKPSPQQSIINFCNANSKLLPPGGEPLILHGSVMGTMVTLRVRLTMQSQHKPIQNFYKYSNDHSKEKLHEKQYNDISRLSFSVTACIRIQQHLSRFRKKPEKQGHMWSFAQVYGSIYISPYQHNISVSQLP